MNETNLMRWDGGWKPAAGCGRLWGSCGSCCGHQRCQQALGKRIRAGKLRRWLWVKDSPSRTTSFWSFWFNCSLYLDLAVILVDIFDHRQVKVCLLEQPAYLVALSLPAGWASLRWSFSLRAAQQTPTRLIHRSQGGDWTCGVCHARECHWDWVLASRTLLLSFWWDLRSR